MLSTCPKCKKQIDHEDFMFEVLCECGSRFNPFMDMGETPAAESETPAPPAWQDPAAVSPESFDESQAVFEEIKEFAETGKETKASMVVENPSPPKRSPTPSTAPRPAASGASEQIMTSGDGLPGYRIESYLPPVSASAELESESSNPMHRGFAALWDEAVKEGATGIVAVRWVLSPNGSRVILSGTPVICVKE